MNLHKHWFSLTEISSEWNCTIDDLIHFGQAGDLEICTDWKALSDQFKSYHVYGSFEFEAAFIEQFFFAFSKPEYKRPEVLSGIRFMETFSLFYPNNNNDEELKTYLPQVDEDTPAIARLIALKSDLFYGKSGDCIWLPSSTSKCSPERIGFLSDYDFCLFSKTKEGVSLHIDKLVITRAEKARIERNSLIATLPEEESTEQELLLGLDEEQIPNNLYFALSLYKQAWHDLPDDMRKPLKKELVNLLEQKGLTNSELINSIIKVSTPNSVKLGGKQSPDLKPWKPIEQRK